MTGPMERGWIRRRGGIGRMEGRRGVRWEGGVRVAKLEVKSKVDIAAGGGKVKGRIASHAPHPNKLLQGSCKEILT